MRAVIFTLKCVGCGKKEDRSSADCAGQQPFCSCGMPMILAKTKLGNQRNPKTLKAP